MEAPESPRRPCKAVQVVEVIITVRFCGALFSWLERLPVTQEVAGSSPVAPANYQFFRIVARSLMCRDALTWNGCDDGSSLYRRRRTPKGTSVKPFRISSQHLVVELLRSCGISREFLKIEDVLPGLSEDPSAVIVIVHNFCGR